ncbi:MAG: alcohol dehydrogenase catalytic domain-containing protein [Acidobacteria bacterium]|nr:alcohol dehydrogenase catalytic domain-containing protein [Acidobacteriota bacterium]
MKAAFLTGLRQIAIQETAPPEIMDSRSVLLRVGAVGVCGSDVHFYTMGRIGSSVAKYPEWTGHECAGTVVATGKEVKRLKVGQRVAIDPLIRCGKCDQCLSGREHTCRYERFLGVAGRATGALAEYLVMPEESCFAISDSMTMVQAVATEPLSVGVYAQRLAGMQPGAKIAILGSGPIGLCVLLASRAACDCKAYLTDLVDERLEMARQCGANWVGNASKIDVARALQEIEPLGMDFVFECAGQQETLDQAVEILKPGGTLLIIGIPETDRVSFNAHDLRRKEIRLQNVHRQNECTAAAIELITSGKINVDQIVTHHFPLVESQRAFDLVADRRDGVVKAMIHVAD